MGERTVERDEPVLDEQSETLRRAVERAERAEAELQKLKTEKTGDAGAASERGTGATEGKAESDAIQTGAIQTGAIQTGVVHRAGNHLVEPGSMDRSKQPAAQEPSGHVAGEPETHGVDALREDSMMAHLLDSLDRGEDIGHYGRLVFAMIARHFLSDDEVLAELTKDRDFSDEQARQMLVQVEGRDYSPPRRERILEWQAEQEFTIIPNRHDPDCGNVYKTLRFPKQTYDHIGHYQEEKANS